MTKVYREYEVAEQRKELMSTVCDWCGCEIPKHPKDCSGGSYPETEISFMMVHPCWENTGGTGWGIEDLCEQCGEKLATLLRNAGIKLGEIDF
jgi:hypothetical protein